MNTKTYSGSTNVIVGSKDFQEGIVGNLVLIDPSVNMLGLNTFLPADGRDSIDLYKFESYEYKGFIDLVKDSIFYVISAKEVESFVSQSSYYRGLDTRLVEVYKEIKYLQILDI